MLVAANIPSQIGKITVDQYRIFCYNIGMLLKRHVV